MLQANRAPPPAPAMQGGIFLRSSLEESTRMAVVAAVRYNHRMNKGPLADCHASGALTKLARVRLEAAEPRVLLG